DGSWVRSDTLLADDAAQDDSLGVSVSLDGDRALVGAPGNSDGAGAAYVFERQENGSWAQVAKLTPGDADARHHIGWFVSLSGDRALVGCWPTSEGNELVKTCTPYIFERQGDGSWEQTARIVTPDAAEENQYALSASLEGSHAVVGIAVSPADDPQGAYAGAYVFERKEDGSWAQVQRLVPQGSLGQGEDVLILTGWSVDLDGDRVLLGALAINRDASSSDGAAYLFERQSDGTWAQTKETMGSESADYLYGWSVALDGDVVVVGTVGFLQNAAYVYTGSTGTAAEDERELPEAALLHANYPNPFGPRTTIPFTLPTATHVTIKVYDVLGREVATLMDAEQPAGSRQVTWEAANVPSGVYVVRLTAGAAMQTRTVVVQK
ncbi:MAG TPA: T9SS type A sorting domain-containing protein, partial [Rhodothermales bacterium]|nr:T9SS type A sorting domain-containing protein [Rhodothermales bacterium]